MIQRKFWLLKELVVERLNELISRKKVICDMSMIIGVKNNLIGEYKLVDQENLITN